MCIIDYENKIERTDLMQTFMLIMTTVFAFGFPIALMIYWKKRCNLTNFPFIMGSLCFLLFAMGLEQMLHAVVIGMENPISERINNTPWLYVLYGCLAAGIFEETGRYFGFSVLLRNYKEKEVSVAYGIGHGGIETIMTLGLTYGMLALVSLGVSLGDEQTSELLWKTINSAGAGEMCLAMLERVSAMMLHIGLSVLVFAAVRRGKKLLYPLAIVLHALSNISAGLYQVGILSNIILVEFITFVCALCVLGGAVSLYRKM